MKAIRKEWLKKKTQLRESIWEVENKGMIFGIKNNVGAPKKTVFSVTVFLGDIRRINLIDPLRVQGQNIRTGTIFTSLYFYKTDLCKHVCFYKNTEAAIRGFVYSLVTPGGFELINFLSETN